MDRPSDRSARSGGRMTGLRERHKLRKEGLATGKTHFRTASGRQFVMHKVDINKDEFDHYAARLREIERIITARHGLIVPDPAGTDDVETCLDYARAVAASHPRQSLSDWAARWMPWAKQSALEDIARAAFWRKYMVGADECAKILCLTWAERCALDIKTIGACDVTREQRAELSRERKRNRDRETKAEQRRAAGKLDRESWIAQSLSQQKPWLADGVSRRTWERRQARVASASRVECITTIGEQPATASFSTEYPVGAGNGAGVRGGKPRPGGRGAEPLAYTLAQAPEVTSEPDISSTPAPTFVTHSVVRESVGTADAGLHGTGAAPTEKAA